MSWVRIGSAVTCRDPLTRAAVAKLASDDPLDIFEAQEQLGAAVARQTGAGAEYVLVDLEAIEREGPAPGASAVQALMMLLRERGGDAPPCLASADPSLLEGGLSAYAELGTGGGRAPLIMPLGTDPNEVTPWRRRFAFGLVTRLAEPPLDGSALRGPSAETLHETAREHFESARKSGFKAEELFFDLGALPLRSDTEGRTKEVLDGARRIGEDEAIAGAHTLIALPDISEGLPRRVALERAYVRVAGEYGVDAAICDAAQISGADLVDPKILRLVRAVVEKPGEALKERFGDYIGAHAAKGTPQTRKPQPNPFRERLLARTEPVFTLELTPHEGDLAALYELAEAARGSEVILSLSDAPAGEPLPAPDGVAIEVARIMGRQPVVHVSCKGYDRDGLESRIMALYSHGLQNLFVVTGDYPPRGRASFDLDSVALLWALRAFKQGLDFPEFTPREIGPMADVFCGAAVSPFKYTEADIWGQCLKLWKKWRVGAGFFITQVGFDVKKFHELRLYMARAGMADVPVLGNAFVLSPESVLGFYRGRVPGAYVSGDVRDKHRRRLVTKADKNVIRRMSFEQLAAFDREQSLHRTALLADVLIRGLGYAGAHLGGLAAWEDVAELLELRRELAQRDWRENYEAYRDGDGERKMAFAPEDRFYLFRDGGDGLLADGPFQSAGRRGYARTSRAMGAIHRVFFERGSLGSKLMEVGLRRSDRRGIGRALTLAEEVIKRQALGCEMCGDCRIADLEYLCPEPTDGCFKSQINGPCGGSTADGMCEVDPTRQCYWGKVIERALVGGTMDELFKLHLPKDPSLGHTSSWRNELLGFVKPPIKLAVEAPGPTPG